MVGPAYLVSMSNIFHSFRSEIKQEKIDSKPSTPLKTLIAVNFLGGMIFGYNTGTYYGIRII